MQDNPAQNYVKIVYQHHDLHEETQDDITKWYGEYATQK